MKFLVFLYIVWIIRTMHDACLFTYLWQLKEYRLDRMMDLWSTPKGRGHYWNVFFAAALILVPFVFISRYHERLFLFVMYATAVVFFAEALRAVAQVFLRKFKRPKITIKSLLILFLTLGITALLVLWLIDFQVFAPDMRMLVILLLASSVVLGDLNAFIVLFFSPITWRLKRRVFEKALQKRLARADLTVIGITGSFGKTTTKVFLSTILSEKFSVLSTSGNVNTEIGVANTILKKLESKYQIFIAEMGAYRKGEIRTICEYARPDIGILTGVNEQHVGLFGSIEKTMEAKFELIESLPSSGLAVFNADNENSFKLSQGVKTPKQLVSIEEPSDVWASDIRVTEDGVSFLVHADDVEFPAHCHVSGKHNIINILACVCVALKLGMSVTEIQKGIGKLTMPDRTMKITRLQDMVIIDDTYNTNTDGIRSALSYMHDGYADHKKIVVFPGVLELGERSADIHVELGDLIAKHTDLFIISNTDFAKYLIRGARSAGNIAKKILVIEDPKKVVSVINSVSGKKIVLFESRGMEKALAALKEKP